jgi:hypothetical protein
MMQLPFTHEQFLDGLGAYNVAFLPAEVALWLLTVAVTVQWVRGRDVTRLLPALLAGHWAWSGIVYHAGYFTRINPAAWAFAALFVLGALAFAWQGIVRRTLAFDMRRSARHALAVALVIYALAYPALVIAAGLTWPRMPAFAVPCPTTLYTAGVLLTLRPAGPRVVFIAPILWALVGGSAALTLGIAPDFGLFVAAAAMLVYAVQLGRMRPGR